MKTLFVLTIACALLPGTLMGGESSIYILRTEANLEQGIIRFNPETRAEAPFASFIYSRGLIGPWASLRLTATADRIIATGHGIFEFDAASGQLIRRYSALSGPYETWAFHGAVVDPAMAARLGIAAGYYGWPICGDGPDPTGLGCNGPTSPFPGYRSQTNLSEQHVLLRRGYDPGDTSLAVAKLFDPLSSGGHPATSSRFTTLDVARSRFWFWLQGSTYDEAGFVQRLSWAPIANGAIGDESIIREERWRSTESEERVRAARVFAHDSGRDVFFLSFLYPYSQFDRRLIRQTIEGSEEILKQSSRSLDGIAVLSPVLSEAFTQLIPVIGETPGVNGTYWQTDAWLFNPSDRPMLVTLRRVAKPDSVQVLTIGARASLKIANTLRKLGGGPSGDGVANDALIVESDYRTSAQLSVYTRTYTPAPFGGTYGQAVPAVPSLIGYSNYAENGLGDLSDTYSVFVLDKRDPEQYRHNIGVVNPSDDPVTIRLRYAVITESRTPDPDREKTLVIPPHSVRQYSMEALFPAPIVETTPPWVRVTGDRPVALWLSIVDNKTGDASFIPFTHYGVDTGASARLAVPAIAYTAGANGTFWRTDGYGIFWNRYDNAEPQRPDANFYSATGGCSASTWRLTPSPGARELSSWGLFWYTTYADLARQACPYAADVRGALEVRTGSWMSLFTRTYTTREDGGTYGEILPLYPPRGWPQRHFAGIDINPAVRVNLGLYNGTDAMSKVELRLYAANGDVAAVKTIELSPRASLQAGLRQLIGIDLVDGLYGLSVATIEGPGCWPYVSTVDNITGDPTNWW